MTNPAFVPYRIVPEVEPIIRDLFKLANRAEMTRDELARLSGVPKGTISNWQRGMRGRVDLVDTCFQALGYRLSYVRNS